jgi:hypothetical protein
MPTSTRYWGPTNEKVPHHCLALWSGAHTVLGRQNVCEPSALKESPPDWQTSTGIATIFASRWELNGCAKRDIGNME